MVVVFLRWDGALVNKVGMRNLEWGINKKIIDLLCNLFNNQIKQTKGDLP